MFACNFDEFFVGKRLGIEQNGDRNAGFLMACETTDCFSWRRRQIGEGHAELRERTRVNGPHQPDKNVVKNADLRLVKAARIREQQIRYPPQYRNAAFRSARNGIFKLRNKFGRNKRHGAAPVLVPLWASFSGNGNFAPKVLISFIKTSRRGCEVPLISPQSLSKFGENGVCQRVFLTHTQSLGRDGYRSKGGKPHTGFLVGAHTARWRHFFKESLDERQFSSDYAGAKDFSF
jgi:hypothetical protein